MLTGRIHSYETLGGLDGPGVRTVVFLQGCPLHCGYCHNPDTWDPCGGTEESVASVLARIRRYRPYYGTEGGVTLSGGEPLMQAEFAAELLEACRAEGIHTAIDTAGCRITADVHRALSACDLVILDVKHTDPGRFHALTGGDIRGMREVFDFTARKRTPLWIRQVIVPGWNDTPEDIDALAEFAAAHPSVQRVELLGYHTMGLDKWHALGIPCPFADTPPLGDDRLAVLRQRLDSFQVSDC